MLSAADRDGTRKAALRAATVALEHAGTMLYSEGPDRWSGIQLRRRSWLGEYPAAADCSSFYTWCLWDATRWLRLGDVVNGADWQAGYTGTMTQHGAQVPLSGLIVGDAVLYGYPGEIPYHTAFYAGNGKVISHGHPGGPTLEAYNSGPIQQARRYV